MQKIIPALALAATLLLTACSGQHDANQATATGDKADAALPSPESGKGSVTGMPDHPGPGPVGAPDNADALPPDTPVASDGDALPPPPDDATAPPVDTLPGNDGASPPPPAATAEPTPDDAVVVVRDYYAAIDHHDYAHAWHLWSQEGRASGKSLQQFSDGFSDTTHVGVQTQAPGREDAGAGQRYIEVPVSVTAQHDDGSAHHYTGIYTLHRTVVDGASDEQRAWRINSAQLRETN